MKAVIQMVDAFKADPELELELRLGRKEGGSFVASTSEAMQVRIDRLLSNSKSFDSSQWQESHDYFFDGPGGKPVRSSVTFDADALTVRTAVVHKTVVMRTNFEMGDLAIRAALNREVAVLEECEPAVRTNHVRIKQRKSHLLRAEENANANVNAKRSAGEEEGGDGEGGGAYMRYDLSRTWSARTRSEAESRQRGGEAPAFEVEIELLRNEAYLRRASSRHVARSMLMKVKDLVLQQTEAGDDGKNWMLLLDEEKTAPL